MKRKKAITSFDTFSIISEYGRSLPSETIAGATMDAQSVARSDEVSYQIPVKISSEKM